jgi:hypothetical protein
MENAFNYEGIIFLSWCLHSLITAIIGMDLVLSEKRVMKLTVIHLQL